MQRMKEPYKKGIANRLDPESCACIREGACEALTGARIGRVLSLENCKPERRRRSTERKAKPRHWPRPSLLFSPTRPRTTDHPLTAIPTGAA